MPDNSCRVCGENVREFFDFGWQPVSDAFVSSERSSEEFFYRLAIGACTSCTMVQLVDEVPRDRMFHAAYPYLSSGSATMREHFRGVARRFLGGELAGDDPFVVELGCNDGAMLASIADAGVRHLGVEPSAAVAAMARDKGVTVLCDFFEESTASAIQREHGPADVVYAANTFCHIPYAMSVLRGVHELLGPDGVFVFEDPYFGDIVERTSFDQIYDEHFFYFTARSVQAMASRSGFELVNVERLPVHGGELRYTLARKGSRSPSPTVEDLVEEERRRGLTHPGTLVRFAARVEQVRRDLPHLLDQLRENGRRVLGYGATAKSATVLNYCGIGPELVPAICDNTPTKQGKLTPGSRIPVYGPQEFRSPFPDYAVLFAWNHADEIMAKEREFRRAGGRWIRYVPEVRVD